MTAHTTTVREVTWAWTSNVAADPAVTNVVFVHGFQNDGTAWAPLLEGVRGDPVRQIVVDLPGCGASPAPPTWQRSTIPELAADLTELIRVEGLAPAIVIGHSLGGGIALQVALDAPELVGGLVLFAPASTRGLDFVDDEMAERLGHPTPQEQHDLLLAAFHRPPDDATLATLEATIRRASPVHIEGAARSMRTFAVEDRLAEISCPVLLVAGDRDRHVPLRNHLATWSHLRRAGLHVEHDVGHVPFVEAPAVSARLVSELVDDVRRRQAKDSTAERRVP